jgi:hypothetical protein
MYETALKIELVILADSSSVYGSREYKSPPEQSSCERKVSAKQQASEGMIRVLFHTCYNAVCIKSCTPIEVPISITYHYNKYLVAVFKRLDGLHNVWVIQSS